MDSVNFSGVVSLRRDFAAIRQRCSQMKKVSLALAAVLTLAGIAGGCATKEPEKPAPIVRKG